MTHLWLVDPAAHLLEAFVRTNEHDVPRWTRLGAWSDDTDARIPPFDAVALDLTLLWVTGASPSGS